MPQEYSLNEAQKALVNVVTELDNDVENTIDTNTKKLEDLTKKKHFVQFTQTLLSVLTTGSILSVIFSGEQYTRLLAIISAIISSLVLFLTQWSKSRNYDESSKTLISAISTLNAAHQQYLFIKIRIYTDDLETIRKSIDDLIKICNSAFGDTLTTMNKSMENLSPIKDISESNQEPEKEKTIDK